MSAQTEPSRRPGLRGWTRYVALPESVVPDERPRLDLAQSVSSGRGATGYDRDCGMQAHDAYARAEPRPRRFELWQQASTVPELGGAASAASFAATTRVAWVGGDAAFLGVPLSRIPVCETNRSTYLTHQDVRRPQGEPEPTIGASDVESPEWANS